MGLVCGYPLISVDFVLPIICACHLFLPKVLDSVSIVNSDCTFLIRVKAPGYTAGRSAFWLLRNLDWFVSLEPVSAVWGRPLLAWPGNETRAAACTPPGLQWMSCVTLTTVKTVCAFHPRVLWKFKPVYLLTLTSLLFMELDCKCFNCKVTIIQE